MALLLLISKSNPIAHGRQFLSVHAGILFSFLASILTSSLCLSIYRWAVRVPFPLLFLHYYPPAFKHLSALTEENRAWLHSELLMCFWYGPNGCKCALFLQRKLTTWMIGLSRNYTSVIVFENWAMLTVMISKIMIHYYFFFTKREVFPDLRYLKF